MTRIVLIIWGWLAFFNPIIRLVTLILLSGGAAGEEARQKHITAAERYGSIFGTLRLPSLWASCLPGRVHRVPAYRGPALEGTTMTTAAITSTDGSPLSYEGIAADLRRHIIHGTIPPGSMLKADVIARRYGISGAGVKILSALKDQQVVTWHLYKWYATPAGPRTRRPAPGSVPPSPGCARQPA
jgi:hypothetical protein